MGMLLLFCGVLLTGCATKEGLPTVRYIKPDIPAGLLTCDPAPSVPPGEFTQRDVARYVVGLHASGDDCRVKLAAVSNIVSNRHSKVE